ncbi:MAG: calcium/sodium antiporter [Rhodoferax sp.]|uniref:calcium/sodium antiporter n=1 Tax=Rhodoferax sp. TaxID=50421 RepID=UPI0013FE53A7|nr:calcium/sodium antiporter [Rhodoferax sp.]NDP38107.1 calcium/sodium antiporter [Rhodoferax sp.]
MTLLMFVAGLLTLLLGADLLVRGASKLALALGISPLVVGLTVVSFGTSAPEVAVSIGAVLEGKTDLALGNAIGSNIFNVLFILGVSALITPLVVNIQLIRQEVPIMLGASLLLLLFALDGQLGLSDGLLLLGLMLAYTVFLVRQSRRQTRAAQDEYAGEFVPAKTGSWLERMPAQLLLIALGLGLLVLGSDWLVQASVVFAKALGVSDLVIGLTIVSAGTSMPEVATSVMAAIKGERDIAVGNVVGSNTFNILGSLGIAGVVNAALGNAGLDVPAAAINFDLWVMSAVALACVPVFMTGREIARWEGAVFLAYYVAYVAYLVLAAQQHAALSAFSGVMLSFVLPLTVITLVVLGMRKPPAADANNP